jgi:hypothetical protein
MLPVGLITLWRDGVSRFGIPVEARTELGLPVEFGGVG